MESTPVSFNIVYIFLSHFPTLVKTLAFFTSSKSRNWLSHTPIEEKLDRDFLHEVFNSKMIKIANWK